MQADLIRADSVAGSGGSRDPGAGRIIVFKDEILELNPGEWEHGG